MLIAFAIATGIEYNACPHPFFITRLQLIRVKTASKRIRKVVHQISCLMLTLVKSDAGAVFAALAKQVNARLLVRSHHGPETGQGRRADDSDEGLTVAHAIDRLAGLY
jgi:hypothetical protein